MPVRPTSPTSEGVLIDGMATHDTDPHRAQPPFPSHDEARTDPGDATTDEGSSAIAESLLADLARAPLPADNVRETEGHNAAAYAVAPHRPPRANDKTIETAAVVVETTTEPLPVPLPATQETTVPGGARLVATVPSERARSSRRIVLASIGGAVVAAAIAILVVVLGGPEAGSSASTPSSAATAAPPPPAPSPSAATSASPDPSPSPSIAATTPPATATTATAASSMTASSTTTAAPRASAKPAGTARPSPPPSARPPRPPGNFAEPDRSF